MLVTLRMDFFIVVTSQEFVTEPMETQGTGRKRVSVDTIAATMSIGRDVEFARAELALISIF